MTALIDVSKGESEAEIDYETLEVKFQHGVYSLTPDGLLLKKAPDTINTSTRPSIETDLQLPISEISTSILGKRTSSETF